MRNTTFFYDHSGFTLVELMVVVAIIGLLSAVAVPNFKKYQAKSKITEAKLQLSALYTSEATFFSDYNMYGKCLRYMGFDPEKERNNRYYGVGFTTGTNNYNDVAYAAAVNSGLQSADCVDNGAVYWAPSGGITKNNYGWFPAGKGIGGSIVNNKAIADANPAGLGLASGQCVNSIMGGAATTGGCFGNQSNVENMAYQASAVGYISGDYLTPTTASGLNINHNKILKSVVNGY